MLGQTELARTLLPVGDMTKDEVRAEAAALGLRTADKPDSQDVCFVTSTAGRAGFLGSRIPLRPGRVVDDAGAEVGRVDAVELVTVGQRRGLGVAGGGAPRYAVDVDVASATVRVGGADELLSDRVVLEQVVWAGGPITGPVEAQCSAHGAPRAATVAPVAPDGRGRPDGDGSDDGRVEVRFAASHRRVAAGQSVVLYQGDEVVGGGIVAVPTNPVTRFTD